MSNENRLIELDIHNAPSLRFTGRLVACVDSKTPTSPRWTVLALYRTTGCKYVCYKEGRSDMPGERTKNAALVAETPAEVIEFFKHGPLSKLLYKDAEIDDVTVVD